MKINLSSFKRGKGIWKLNCSLLQDKKYIEMVNNIIESVKQEYSVPVYNLHSLATILNNEIHLTVSDSQFLEILPLKIRGENIKYSSIKKRISAIGRPKLWQILKH